MEISDTDDEPLVVASRSSKKGQHNSTSASATDSPMDSRSAASTPGEQQSDYETPASTPALSVAGPSGSRKRKRATIQSHHDDAALAAKLQLEEYGEEGDDKKAVNKTRKLAIEDTDSIIKTFHFNLSSDVEQPLIPDLTPEEKLKFAKAEAALNDEPEKRMLDEKVDEQASMPQAKKARLEAIA